MSFPVSSQLVPVSDCVEPGEGRCNVCKEWRKPCFNCVFAELKERFSLTSSTYATLDFDALGQINSLEYLSNHPLQFMRPQEDGSFSEQSRTPNTPTRNEPLAGYYMMFADSVLHESREAALEVYMIGLTHHNGIRPLNLRIMLLLVEQGRDIEAISFVESLIQWPTMRFTPEIWFGCRDSIEDEMDVSLLSKDLRVVVALIKRKIVRKLESNRAKFQTFGQTKSGQNLEQVHSVLANILGISSFMVEQQRQLDALLETLDPITCEAITGDGSIKNAPELDELLLPSFNFCHTV